MKSWDGLEADAVNEKLRWPRGGSSERKDEMV